VSRFVSRQHALLLRNPDGDWIVDLKSTNGTSVNSQLVRQRRLVHGDVISIGNHRLRYQNSAARPGVPEPTARADQLSETMVMRSLQAVVAQAPADAEPASTTAA
jgi:pSer/pThr/pTyr-binding forkhead associated (FHA) protein